MAGRRNVVPGNNLRPLTAACGNFWTAEAYVQMSNNSQNPGKTTLAGGRTSKHDLSFPKLHPAIVPADRTHVELGDDRENGREEAENPAGIRLFHDHARTGSDCTITRVDRQFGKSLESHTQKTRSRGRNFGRLTDCLQTAACCRSTRFSTAKWTLGISIPRSCPMPAADTRFPFWA